MRRLAILCLVLLAATAASADEVDDLLARVDASKGRDRVIALRACKGQDDGRVVARAAEMSRAGSIAERAVAVEVLGAAGGDAAVTALVAVSEKDDEGMLCGMALRELGRLGHAASFDRMVAALQEHTARTSAIHGIRLLGDPRGYEPVRSLYAERPDDPYVHEAAPEALIALDRDRAVPLLIARFREGGAGERSDVADALASGRDERVVTALLPELAGDEPFRRRQAIRALAGAGDAATVERLVAHADRLPVDRMVTAEALGGAPEGVAAAADLVRWLRTTDHDGVRGACANALRRLDVRGAAADLAAALGRTPRADSAVRVLEALADLGDRRAVASVAGVLGDRTWIAQDPRLSSIHGFPENVALCEVAAWALVTLRDGREPFPRDDLAMFRQAPRPEHVGTTLADARTWWDAHREDAGLRFE